MKELSIDLNNYNDAWTVRTRKAVRGIVTRKNGAGGFEILLIHGKFGDWKFPGGGMEPGETEVETLVREVREETGFCVTETGEKFAVVTEKRSEGDEILLMENIYYFCSIGKVQGAQDLDDYERDYEYKAFWKDPFEAIKLNESVKDFENIPWIKRETMVLREIVKSQEKNIVMARPENLYEIYELVQKTIRSVYSKYYAAGVVEFFCAHHSMENIEADIQKENVFVIFENGKIAATGTASENHITRIFVLPEFQGMGFGSAIMKFLEKRVFAEYDCVELDSSLPGGAVYDHLGYKTTGHEIIEWENGSVLAYETMRKRKLHAEK